jgi:DNA-binding NarL/FixJ family response regulator
MENNLTCEMHTLLLCADAQFLGPTHGVLSQLKVTPRIVADCDAAIAVIQEHEFDAIIVDWREISNLGYFLNAVRRSKLNRECILVAIVRDLLDLREAFGAGVHLLIHKPASVLQIERCLRAAYCASMARRVKRHREAVSIMASITTRIEPFAEVSIVNLSHGGARVKLDAGSRMFANLTVGAEVDLRFTLPQTNDVIQCTGMVVWTGPEANAGLRFSYIPERERMALEQWLTICVERSRAEVCERLRMACA